MGKRPKRSIADIVNIDIAVGSKACTICVVSRKHFRRLTQGSATLTRHHDRLCVLTLVNQIVPPIKPTVPAELRIHGFTGTSAGRPTSTPHETWQTFATRVSSHIVIARPAYVGGSTAHRDTSGGYRVPIAVLLRSTF